MLPQCNSSLQGLDINAYHRLHQPDLLIQHEVEVLCETLMFLLKAQDIQECIIVCFKPAKALNRDERMEGHCQYPASAHKGLCTAIEVAFILKAEREEPELLV